MRKAAVYIALCAVVLLPRLGAFWYGKVPEGPFGDEKSYLAAALKLQQEGLNGYSLRGIDYKNSDTLLTLCRAASSKGSLLADRKADDFGLSDTPFFYSPPLFPVLLGLSHRIFSPGDVCFPVALFKRPYERLRAQEVKAQFYAAVVPFVASILCTVCTYLLGKNWFSQRAGIGAAFILAVSPIDIMVSHQIWSDGVLALFSCLVLLFLYYGLRSGKTVMFCMSACALGCALLTKNNAVLLLVVAGICMGYHLYSSPSSHSGIRPAYGKITALYAGIVIGMTAFWYSRVWSYYGVFFYNPAIPGISRLNAFFLWESMRPFYTYLVDIPYQNPLFIPGYAYIVFWLFRRKKTLHELMPIVWFLVFFICISVFTATDEMTGPDNRYMLPVYPALCVLSAHAALTVRAWAAKKRYKKVLQGALYAFLGAGGLWSWRLGFIAAGTFSHYIDLPF